MPAEGLILPIDKRIDIDSASVILDNAIKKISNVFSNAPVIGYLKDTKDNLKTLLDEKWSKAAEFFTSEKKNKNSTASKIKKKLYKMYDKYLIKGKFFKEALKTFKGIAKSLANLAGNWFTKILGFLLLMAVIDPNGSMIESLLGMVANLAMMLINTIIKNLPKIFKIILNIIDNVIPRILRSIADILFGGFGKDSLIYQFFHDILPAIFPTLLKVFLVLGIIMPIISALAVVFSPIGLIVGGIVILVYLLYNAWKDIEDDFFAGIALIKKFFKWLWATIKELPSMVWKAIKKIGKWFADLPGKIWKAIKKIGKWFADLPGRLWKGLKKLALSIYKWGAKIRSKLWKGIKNLGSSIAKWFKSLPKRILAGLKKLPGFLLDLLTKILPKGVIDKISKFIGMIVKFVKRLGDILGKVVDAVQSGFYRMYDWMAVALTNPVDYMLAGPKAEGGMLTTQRYAREVGIGGLSDLESLINKEKLNLLKPKEARQLKKARRDLGVSLKGEISTEQFEKIGKKSNTVKIENSIKHYQELERRKNMGDKSYRTGR